MLVVHVAMTNAADYFTRREAYRQAHMERLLRLRARGALVLGGPSPDGRTADLIYRATTLDQVASLVEEDPYRRGGVWTSYQPRSFSRFVEPWEAPPVVLDGSRRVTVVEGSAADPDVAQLALVQLRGAGRLVLAGTLEAAGAGGPPDGAQTLAVLRTADPAEALGWLADTGCFEAARLRTRPLLHVL